MAAPRGPLNPARGRCPQYSPSRRLLSCPVPPGGASLCRPVYPSPGKIPLARAPPTLEQESNMRSLTSPHSPPPPPPVLSKTAGDAGSSRRTSAELLTSRLRQKRDIIVAQRRRVVARDQTAAAAAGGWGHWLGNGVYASSWSVHWPRLFSMVSRFLPSEIPNVVVLVMQASMQSRDSPVWQCGLGGIRCRISWRR